MRAVPGVRIFMQQPTVFVQGRGYKSLITQAGVLSEQSPVFSCGQWQNVRIFMQQPIVFVYYERWCNSTGSKRQHNATKNALPVAGRARFYALTNQWSFTGKGIQLAR